MRGPRAGGAAAAESRQGSEGGRGGGVGWEVGVSLGQGCADQLLQTRIRLIPFHRHRYLLFLDVGAVCGEYGG
jgi:hypothetical protein